MALVWAALVLVAIVLLVASSWLGRYRLQVVSRRPDNLIVFPQRVDDDSDWAA